MKLRALILAIPLFLSGCLENSLYAFDWAKDLTASEAWMTLAANGDAEAQYKVATIHCCGDRPRYDNVRALYWFCKAARQNQRDALHRVGEIYETAHEYEGSIIPRNNRMAAAFYQLSATRGSQKAGDAYQSITSHMTDSELEDASALVAGWPDIPCEVYR